MSASASGGSNMRRLLPVGYYPCGQVSGKKLRFFAKKAVPGHAPETAS
jgi:hypothetical protein